MSERQRDEWPKLEPEGGAKTGGETRAGKGDEPGSIARELGELGAQLANTARAAWQSEQRQEIQQEMTEGLRSLRDQLNEAVETLRSNPRTRTMSESMKEQVGKAAEKTRVTEIADDVRGGLTLGLRELNEQLRRFADRLERHDAPAGGGDAATASSAVSSVGGAQTTPSTAQMTTGEYAGRTEAMPSTAGTTIGEGLMDEEPALAPDVPIAGASQAELERMGRTGDQAERHDLPGEPEGRKA